MEAVLVIFVVVAVLMVLSAVGLFVVGFRLVRGIVGGLSRLVTRHPHLPHRRGANRAFGARSACPRPGCNAPNAASARYCRRCGSGMDERYDQAHTARRRHSPVRRAVA